MKRFTLLFAMATVTVAAHAQLLVDSLGKAAFGTTTNSSYQINVEGANNGIKCTSGLGTPLTTAAINAIAYPNATYENVGVKGIVQTQGTANGFSFGIYGLAKSSHNGCNIGLYGGIIPQYNGTALYASSSCSNAITSLSSRYAGFFDGDVYVDGGLTVSGVFVNPSLRLFTSNPLRQRNVTGQTVADQLCLLEPATYYMEVRKKSDTAKDRLEVLTPEEKAALPKKLPLTLMEKQTLAKQHYGLDADQLEDVFPDLVYENEDGTKSINYVEMVPILVQAIGELKAEINTLKGENTAKKVKQTTDIHTAETVQLLSLGQNKPNPFSTQTDIEVSVPETVQTAFLYIYDLQGKKVQQVDVTARGKQTVKVDAADLADGMYLYSLIADGKVVETRRMIVEK